MVEAKVQFVLLLEWVANQLVLAQRGVGDFGLLDSILAYVFAQLGYGSREQINPSLEPNSRVQAVNATTSDFSVEMSWYITERTFSGVDLFIAVVT